MAKHKFRSNPPEGGALKTVGYVALGSAAALAAAGGLSFLVGKVGGTWSEAMQDAAIGGVGFLLGAGVTVFAKKSALIRVVGAGVAAGGATLGGVRFAAYQLGGPAIRTAIDAQRAAMSAPAAYALPAGAVVSSNAYMGYGAGAPVSQNAYMGWGVGAA